MGLSYIMYYIGYDSAILTQIGLMTGYQRIFFLAIPCNEASSKGARRWRSQGRLHYRFGNHFLQIPSNYFHSSAFHKRFSFIIKGSLVTATTFKHTEFYLYILYL